jgi:hypothetical protein
MDGCSLADAFPPGASASAGCVDTRTAEESRRQEKKRARKCRGPALTYLNSGMNMVGAVDPDRLAAKLSSVPELNSKTGLTSHQPVTQQYESFIGQMDSLPAITANAKDANHLQSENSFFGADPADTKNPKKATSIAPFVDIIGDDESYRLEPDFSKSFKMRSKQDRSEEGFKSMDGQDKSQEGAYLTPTKMLPSGNLPYPNTDIFWKENGIAGGQSSFFSHLKYPGGQPSARSIESEPNAKNQEVLHKLDRIFARLDDMESSKSENSQTEVLLFILTGLGVIFLMDIGCRAAAMRS